MAPPRTENDQRVMNYVWLFVTVNGQSPTVREICEGLQMRSPSNVHRYLRRLRDEGRIEWDRYARRGIRIPDGG